jgi:hypothetical protein
VATFWHYPRKTFRWRQQRDEVQCADINDTGLRHATGFDRDVAGAHCDVWSGVLGALIFALHWFIHHARQLPRNIFRKSANAFKYDKIALAASIECLVNANQPWHPNPPVSKRAVAPVQTRANGSPPAHRIVEQAKCSSLPHRNYSSPCHSSTGKCCNPKSVFECAPSLNW